jgi:hypothetical protein
LDFFILCAIELQATYVTKMHEFIDEDDDNDDPPQNIRNFQFSSML